MYQIMSWDTFGQSNSLLFGWSYHGGMKVWGGGVGGTKVNNGNIAKIFNNFCQTYAN
jgi:hypothetical protein